MADDFNVVFSDKVFEELRQISTAKKYLEIIERLISDYGKDDVVQIFRNMLLDHEICYQIVGNGKNIKDFYNRIIFIINNMKQDETAEY